MKPQITDFENMPLSERLLLVEKLWDSIARSSEVDLPIPDWQKTELERRKREYLKNPGAAVSWSEVKRSILESRE